MKRLEELNTEQKQAVETSDGPVMIVAGPGTGKTKTLSARIAYVLQNGAAAEDILALTFTKKAAKEMEERVRKLLGGGQTLPRMCTFHALCHSLLGLRSEGETRFISDQQRLSIIKSLAVPATLKDLTSRELGLLITRAKNQSGQPEDTHVAKLVKHYDAALRERDLHDFDDLLRRTVELLQQGAGKQWSHILVDEFQDTSQLQYDLLLRLNAADNLFVIGDPRQSIYGFRAGDWDAFGRFRHDFPRAKAISLAVNYRSTPEIVTLANAIFPDTLKLRAYRGGSGEICAVQVLNEYSESNWIIRTIEQAVGGSDMLKSHAKAQELIRDCCFKDFAVLYRSRRACLTLQKLLHDSGLPYQVAGEDSPYEQPPIRAITAVLRFLANPSEDERRTLAAVPLLDALSKTQLDALLAGLAPRALDATVNQLAESVAKTFNITTPHLAGFTAQLVRFDAIGLETYITHLETIAEQGFYDPRADAVTLLTIHAAKGLEFSYVFLIGVEEGILPHDKAMDIEEERRLFYVAATRAQECLDILHAKTRRGIPRAPSRFITELSPAVLPRLTDPGMPAQKAKIQKRKIKNSQTRLFS